MVFFADAAALVKVWGTGVVAVVVELGDASSAEFAVLSSVVLHVVASLTEEVYWF